MFPNWSRSAVRSNVGLRSACASNSISGFGSEREQPIAHREGYGYGIILVYNRLASLVIYSKCL